MSYFLFYCIICLCFISVIDKSFDGISSYGFFRLLLLTLLWPFVQVSVLFYIMFNSILDFLEDKNDRS